MRSVCTSHENVMKKRCAGLSPASGAERPPYHPESQVSTPQVAHADVWNSLIRGEFPLRGRIARDQDFVNRIAPK